MKDNFKTAYRRLLKSTDFGFHRYLFDAFNLKSRLTGLVGPCGTGKTPLLLQYIREKVSFNHISPQKPTTLQQIILPIIILPQLFTKNSTSGPVEAWA